MDDQNQKNRDALFSTTKEEATFDEQSSTPVLNERESMAVTPEPESREWVSNWRIFISFSIFFIQIFFTFKVLDEKVNSTQTSSIEQVIDNPLQQDNSVAIQDEQFIIYRVAIHDKKEEVIEVLGTNYSEEKDVVIDGTGMYDRFIYFELDLTLLFIKDKLVSIDVPIHNQIEFEQYFANYTGEKFMYKGNDQNVSEGDTYILFFERTGQVAIATYDLFGTLTLSIRLAPPELITNYKKGILSY